jgi:hypothetical protein
VLVLDDFLSSIDRRTQRIISHNLFSKDDGYVVRHGCALLVTTHVTTYIHLADNLVVLDAQGSTSYSGAPANYISANEEIAKSQDEELPEQPPTNPEAFEGDAPRQDLKPKAEDPVDTIKRQKGDMAVWTYYGKAIGLWSILICFFCIAVNVFGNNFQSRSRDISIVEHKTNLVNRIVATVEHRGDSTCLGTVFGHLYYVRRGHVLLSDCNVRSGLAEDGSEIRSNIAQGARQDYCQGAHVLL